MAEDLVVTVERITGTCPVYHESDKFFIRKGFILESNRRLCLHGLASMIPFYACLARGISPSDLGLGSDCAYVHCPDPCQITNGGTVLFKIEKEVT